MPRPFRSRLLGHLLAALLLLGPATPGFATVNSVTIDLSGLTLKNGLNQARDSGSNALPAADEYLYSISGTVHGTGLLAFPFNLIPNGTPLDGLLNSLVDGAGDLLAGTAPNPTGSLPLALVNQSFSANDGFLAAGATLTASIDEGGVVRFAMTDVVLSVNGFVNSSNSVVFEAGTKLTVSVPPGRIKLAAPTVSVDENAGTLLVSIQRAGLKQGVVSVRCSTTPGTAAAGVDFDAFNQIISFPDGVDTRTISIGIRDNAQLSLPRSFTVNLSEAAGGASLGDITTTTVSIIDNELPPLPLAAGTYEGLLQTGGGDLSALGLVSITITKAGSYTAKVLLGSDRFSAKGKIPANGPVNSVDLRNSNGRQLSFEVNRQSPTGLLARVQGGSLGSAQASLQPAVFSKASPFLQAGSYTVLYEPPAPDAQHPASTFPQGSGYATLKATAAGSIRAVGKFPDGSSAGASGKLVGAGEWPMFIAQKTRAVAAGLLVVRADNAANDLTGAVTLIRAPLSTGSYPNGFRTTFQAAGSRFLPPARGSRVLDLPAPQFSVGGGNLLHPFSVGVTIGTDNKVTVASPGSTKLKVTLQPKTGLLTGSFEEAAESARPRKFSGIFQGAVLQKQKRAGGYFLGVDPAGLAPQSGFAILE